MLIKKTIVLGDGTNAVGHLSLIRVGNETGAKLTLAKPFEGAYLMLKVGGKPQENFSIVGLKNEYALEGNVEPNDQIGALIVGKDGVLASGGLKGIVNEKLVEREKEEEANTTDSGEPKVELEGTKKEEIEAIKEEIEAIVEESVGANEGGEEAEVEEGESQEVAVNEEENVVFEETVGVEPLITPFKNVKGENFYRNVRSKLSEIMTANPSEKKLEELIPDSKWVRVYYEKGEYYVVGILTEDGEVTFLAYGVPGVRSVKPPKDAEELCDFVEVESSIGEGYWVMFQNAKNGEIVKSI